MDKIDNRTKTLAEATSDYGRKEFIKSHILIMGKAIAIRYILQTNMVTKNIFIIIN